MYMHYFLGPSRLGSLSLNDANHLFGWSTIFVCVCNGVSGLLPNTLKQEFMGLTAATTAATR